MKTEWFKAAFVLGVGFVAFGALLKFLNPGKARSYSEFDLARGFAAGAPWVMVIGTVLILIGLIGTAISG